MRKAWFIVSFLIGNTCLLAADFEQSLAEFAPLPVFGNPLFLEEQGPTVPDLLLEVPPEPVDIPAEPESESTQPPAAPKSERTSLSTVDTAPTAIVDLRPPQFSMETAWLEVEPSWLNGIIDDHILIWQNVNEGLTTVARGGTDFGITSLGFKFDVIREEGPFWMQGFFGWNFLNGPTTAAVAPQTYDLGVEFNYSRKLGDTWGLALSVSPLFSTDFDNKSRDSFRLTAGGLLTFQADDVTRLVAGLTFLDRPDLPFIPIAGLKWMVTENLEMDLLVPRPKLAWRFDRDQEREAWFYTAGEVGGGSWAIERENQMNDRLGYRDLRWVWGVESRQINGSRRVLEAGYVFDRRISLYRGTGDERLGNSFVFRWGRLY